VAYGTARGKERWVSRYSASADGSEAASSIAVAPDGSHVYVTGHSQVASIDYTTIAYEATTGEERLVARYRGPSDVSVATSLAVNPAGPVVYVTGESKGPSGRFDYATVACASSSGRRLWEARYGPAGGDDQARSVATGPDGRTVYVGGTAVYVTGDSGSIDYGIVAYDATTGRRLWVAHYDGPVHRSDRLNGMAVDPDGFAIFVTGESSGAGDVGILDVATIAYRG
jgi:outer membrane protein assembly factor BamB